jgi:L-alanine-DL-glutamate epimerase-like enolase superfamily enzyme
MDPIETLDVRAYTIPAASPEADGTIAWAETTIVTIEASAGGETGFGYTYGDVSVGILAAKDLAKFVLRREPTSPRALWISMVQSVRNIGRPGVAAMAISAVDMAIWDLKARLLKLPITALIGGVRESIPVYGSGGFTSYSIPMLEAQLGGWAQDGIKAVKMKVGTHPEDDVDRVSAVREAIGPDVDLYVDANGAYTRKQALEKAFEFADLGVCWFEEPVSSDDLPGLRHMRDHAPPRMEIAAGEYGYDGMYFRRMLEEGAVDVIQADATRCGGVTGFLSAAELADAWNMPLSAHTAPSLHAHLCCCVPRARNVEYFFDHIRIEQGFMDGALVSDCGLLRPDVDSPGFGLLFKHMDAEDYLAFRETCTS